MFRLVVYIGKNGDRYGLYDVRLSVRALPIPNEGKAQQLIDLLKGANQPPVWTGNIDAESSTLLPEAWAIQPKSRSATYVVNVYARNKPTTETMNVRFNEEIKRWQYSYKIIRVLSYGGPNKADNVETLETTSPEWLTTEFIQTRQ